MDLPECVGRRFCQVICGSITAAVGRTRVFHNHVFHPSSARQLALPSHTLKMSNFDQSKAYSAQEQVFFDDGREIELLHFVYSKANINEIRGSPSKVLQAIDEFGRTKKYLMNVGEDKGKIVTDLIADVKPETMVASSCNM